MRWLIRVTQVTAHLSDVDDRDDLPAGDGGERSFRDYEVEGATEDDALDKFHVTIPIGCLEDFEIDITLLGEEGRIA